MYDWFLNSLLQSTIATELVNVVVGSDCSLSIYFCRGRDGPSASSAYKVYPKFVGVHLLPNIDIIIFYNPGTLLAHQFFQYWYYYIL